MKACTTQLCTHGRRACPCPQACEVPEHCAAWSRAASTAGTRPSTADTLIAAALHLAVVATAVMALVYIVKTAAGA